MNMEQNVDNSKQSDGRGLNTGWQVDIDVPFERGSISEVFINSGADSSVCSVSKRMICEYIHDRWEDNTIPSTLKTENVRYGYFAADTLLETFDDPDDDIYRISVTQPIADHIKISIPVHLRLSNIFAGFCMTPRSPMGVQCRITLTAPMIITGNIVTTPLSKAVVNVERVDGNGSLKRRLVGAPYDKEDTNYRLNRQEGSIFGFDIETLLTIHLVSYGRDFATDIGDIHITIPM